MEFEGAKGEVKSTQAKVPLHEELVVVGTKIYTRFPCVLMNLKIKLPDIMLVL